MIKLISSATSDLVVDQRVHRSCKSLTEMGFKVTSIGRIKPNSKSLSDRPYHTKRIKCFFNKGPFFYFEFNLRLFFQLLSLKPGVLLSNDLDTLLANTLVSKLKGIPLVYDSHEFFTEVPELIYRPKVRNIWLKIEKMCINRPSKYITVCESIAKEYGKRYNLGFSVVRNLPERLSDTNVKEEIDLKKMARGKRIILYQGSVNADRGLEEMIDAMKSLNDCFLAIIGGGDVLDQLKTKVNKLELSESVHFLGELPFEKLPAITKQAELGLSIEKKNSLSYTYALPNKVFDYIQNDVPVLMSDLVELKKLNDQYKFGALVNNISAEDLTQKVRLIFNDEKQYLTYKENTKKASEELNWERESEVMKSIFKGLLAPE